MQVTFRFESVTNHPADLLMSPIIPIILHISVRLCSSLISYFGYPYQGSQLAASIVFTCVASLNIVRYDNISFVPASVLVHI